MAQASFLRGLTKRPNESDLEMNSESMKNNFIEDDHHLYITWN